MDTVQRSKKPSWIRHPATRGILLAVVIGAVGFLIISFIRRVSWSSVGESIGSIAWWQLGILLALMMARNIVAAYPLGRYVKGLSWGKAVQNDLTSNVVATFTPPPGDLAIRLAMFKSWRIDQVIGVTGVTLNTITYYAVRFIAPVLGLILFAFAESSTGRLWSGISAAIIAVALLLGMYFFLRSDSWAASIGRVAARIAGRVNADADQDEWAAATVVYRRNVHEVLRKNLLAAIVAGLVSVAIDAATLLVALRFVGVGPDDLSVIYVFAAFFMAYPLTILPAFGLGILDAILIAEWLYISPTVIYSDLVAATVVWRSVTLLGTLAAGLVAMAFWRIQLRRRSQEPGPELGPDPESEDAGGGDSAPASATEAD